MLRDAAIQPRSLRVWRAATGFSLMVELVAGEFIMGENDGDKFATDTERPAHPVTITNNFALSSFPVTVGEFRKFCPGHAQDEADDLPVVRVNWYEAAAFCEWLTLESGRNFRLPTEAEWEFACRAGSRTPFAPGDEILPGQANYLYDENGRRIGTGRRTPAGHYAPNAFGIFDLHGNVCEWVADAWHPDYHGAPADGRAWTEADTGRRVIRGGAWDYLPRLLRSAWRDWRPADCRADNIGFRVATTDMETRA